MQHNSDSLREHGAAAAAEGDHERALEHFRAASGLAPGNPRFHLDIAGVLRKLGRREEAEAAYRRALTLDPDLSDAHRALGTMARDRGDHHRALEHFLAARERASRDPWTYVDVALEYRALGRHDEALTECRTALAVRPDFAEGHRIMALIARDGKDHEQALEHFWAATALAPDNVGYYLGVAGELRSLGRLDEAEATCQQALTVNPDFADTHRSLGFIARDRKDHLAAIAHFEDARSRSAGDYSNALEIAREYRSLGRYDEAIAYYRDILAARPDVADAHRGIGIVLSARGDHEGALEHFRAARNRVPGDPWIYIDVALEYRSLRRHDEALAECRAALTVKPDFAEAHRIAALVERDRKDHEQALEHFRAASALAPGNVGYYLEIAGELRNLNRFDEAETACRQALAVNPDFADAHRTLGFIARDRKDHLAAIAHFEHARNRTAGDYLNTIEIAREYRSLGRHDDAIASYRAALAVRPDSAEAHRGMGFVQSARKDHEEALKHFLTARAVAPGDPWIYIDIALAYRSLRRYDEALAECRAALAVKPDFAEGHRIMALVARDRKEHEQALEHFRVASALAPDNAGYHLEIAGELRSLGRFEEAEAACRQALAINPDLTDARRTLGFIARDRKDHRAAIAHFDEALNRSADDYSSMVEIAREYRSLEQYDEALTYYRAVLVLKPDFAEAHRGIGFVHSARKDHEGALPHFRAASDLAPTNPWIYIDIALAYRTLGRYEDALAECRAALIVKPDFAEVHRIMGFVQGTRGDLLAAQGHFADALACLEAADAAAPGQFLVPIVEMLLQLKQTDAARDRLQAADLHALPAHATAELFRLRATIARKMMDYDEEIACLRASRDLRPDDRYAWLALIGRETGTGRFAEAGTSIEEAERHFPDDPDLAIERAKIYRALGQLDESRRELAAVRFGDDAPMQSRIRLADEFRYNRMLPEARDMARAAVKIEPDNANARLSLALAGLEIDGPAAALAELQDVIASGQYNPDVVYNASRLLRETGNPAAARRLVEERTEGWRAPPHLFQEVILNLIHTNDLAKAWEFLELRKGFNGDDDDDLCMQIELEMAAGNIKKIQKLFATISERPVTHAGIAARVIRMATASHNFEVVIATQKDWIALEPGRELHGMLAVAEAEFHLGRADRTYRILDDLNAKFGAMPEIFGMRAQLLRVSGRVEEALATLREGTEKYPDNAGLWSQWIRFMIQTGALDSASAALENAVPRTQTWREEKALLEIELSLERRDLKACLKQVDMFTPSYLSNRRYYYHLAARAALGDSDVSRAKEFLTQEASVLRFEKKLRRQSSNVSQSLLGQLLDDYRLDETTVTAIRQTDGLSQDERTGRLLGIARDNPESTAAAIATVFHLRNRGLLAGEAGEQGSPIPRRILQFWDTPNVPADISAYMETWRHHNPDWTYDLFDTSRAMEFIGQTCSPRALTAFNKAEDATMKADFFRLVWLNEVGGVYADADDVCAAPLDSIMRSNLRFVGYQEDIGSVGNNFLATVPGHPVIAWALEQAADAILRRDSDMVWLSTGPGLMSRAFIHWLATSADLAGALREARVLERGDLARFCVPHCHATYKFTPKHWSKGLFG